MSPVKGTIIDKGIVDGIIKSGDPDKSYFPFWFPGEGGLHRGSDYDFMVIKKGVRNEREVSKRIYKALFAQKIKTSCRCHCGGSRQTAYEEK